jgi:hypothetical protein
MHLPHSKDSNDKAASTLEMATAASPISSSSIGTNSSELQDHESQHHSALLAPIPLEQQLNLRWERICAFVSTDYDEQGLLSKTVQRCRGQPVLKHEKKQVGHLPWVGSCAFWVV